MSKLDARTGVTHPLGLCTEAVESQIPETVLNSLLAYSGLVGQTRSEIVRNSITDRLFGKFLTTRNAKRSLEAAIEGLAFLEGVDKEEYVQRVLASHCFGELHVLKYGPVGSDAIPDQSLVFPSSRR